MECVPLPLPHHSPKEILTLKLVHPQPPAVHPNFHLHVPTSVTPEASAPGKQFLAVTVWISLALQISGWPFALWSKNRL